MPTEKRQDTLHDRLEKRVLPLYTGRVLPFDLAASQACAELMARARCWHGDWYSRWIYRSHCERQQIRRSHPRHKPIQGCRRASDQSMG